MLAHIKLSRNELWALLTRTFEALYGHERDYYDMARSVLWLECRGHSGVAQFVSALSHLEAGGRREPQLAEISPTEFTVDGQGHSLFCIGRSICDLALAIASETGTAQIRIANVPDSAPLLGVLAYAASQGYAALACYDGVAARISAGQDCPEIVTAPPANALCLICAKTDAALDSFVSQDAAPHLSAQAQSAQYAHNLAQGIEIARADFEAMNHLASRILVESSEASRRGAGE